MSQENIYTTTDFYTTAVLVYKKFKVIAINRVGSGKTKKFVFEDTPELRETILSYMNGEMEGNLREFRNAIDATKDMVHSG